MPLPPDFTLLQVAPELETGGVEQTTVDVAAAVARAGGRALVASRGGRMTDRLLAAGGRLFAMPAHSKNPLTIAANAGRLIRLVRREGVSLIHARSRAPAFSALWAARATGTPFVATYHGVYNARSGLKRWYNAVMTRGDVVIANSEFTRAHVIAEHGVAPERVIAIPRGVDLARFDPAAVSDERVGALRRAWGVEAEDRRVKVLLAGRLTRWKGQALLVEAAARLKAQGREDFLILLAGDDQGRAGYRAELEAAVAAAGLGGQVRLVGHCDDMPAAYLLADLAAAPSLDPEAFGRTAVEPQVMGRPVLAADHGAFRETMRPGETGWLIAPGDAAAWAAALAAAIALPAETRRRMGEAGQARARRLYSVDAMCAATLDVYEGVLEARRRQPRS
ncbi:glycosyl transferase [Caulobacter sp. CCUG 60055]|nr:glycosyltransferase family 4 protein [Caulobacter sp. CCUG 60055]MCI3180977.1 glycosyl transferase [Caulobacter sp. CCUG 60055]